MLRLLPPSPPESLIKQAEFHEREASKLLQLATILRRLADGDDPDDILAELSPQLAKEFKDWEDRS